MTRTVLAFAVGIILACGILTCWVTDLFAVAGFQVAFFLLGVVWLLHRLRRPEPVEFHWIVAVPVAVVLIGLIQLVTGITVNRNNTTAAVLIWACHAIAMFLALQFSVSSRIREKFLSAMLWFATGVSILGVVQNFTSPGKVFWVFDSGYQDFVLGPFVYPNKYAQFIELFLPLALFRALRGSGRTVSSLLMAGTMLAGSIAGASRSGVFLAIIETITFLFIVKWHGWVEDRRAARIGVQAAILFVICGGVVGWEFLGQKLKRDPLSDLRIPIMASSVDMIKERPLTGFGLGTWDKAYPAYARFDNGLYTNQAHCDWLQWPGEAGVVMFGLMLALAVTSLRWGIEHAWSLGVFFVFIHGLIDYPMQQVPQFATLLMVMLAIAAGEQIAIQRRQG